jgi:hypothetical protein
MKPYINISHDHAIAQGNKYTFYYGCDQVDERTGDWMFVATRTNSPKPIFQLTNSQLLELSDTDKQSPESMLLTGVLAFINR